jgi:hypothetical protein
MSEALTGSLNPHSLGNQERIMLLNECLQQLMPVERGEPTLDVKTQTGAGRVNSGLGFGKLIAPWSQTERHDFGS